VTPEKLLFAKSHEWVLIEADSTGAKIATMGLSAFALEALTDLVFIELPELGRQVKAGEPLGEVESVKAVSDIASPVNGEVIEVNATLADNLEEIGADPYGTGWFVKIKLSDESGLSELLDHAAYQKQCEEEAAE